MFTKEGPHQVILGDVIFAEAKFAKDDANAFDICIRVTNKANEAESDWARLEMSANYGKGSFSDRTQAQISWDTLAKLGFEGDDLTTIGEQLTGKEATVQVKAGKPTEDGKVFYNVSYFVTGGGNEPNAITPDVMKARLAALMGGAAAETAPAMPPPVAAPATAAAKPSPFAPKATAAAPATFPPAANSAQKPNPFAAKPGAAAKPNPFAPRG